MMTIDENESLKNIANLRQKGADEPVASFFKMHLMGFLFQTKKDSI